MIKLFKHNAKNQIQSKKAISSTKNNEQSNFVVVTDKSLKDFIATKEKVVLFCWGTGCKYCSDLEPIIDTLAREYRDAILFGSLDVDINKKIVKTYHLHTVPTLLIFKNGKFVDSITGFMPKGPLKSRIMLLFSRNW